MKWRKKVVERVKLGVDHTHLLLRAGLVSTGFLLARRSEELSYSYQRTINK